MFWFPFVYKDKYPFYLLSGYWEWSNTVDKSDSGNGTGMQLIDTNDITINNKTIFDDIMKTSVSNKN